MGDDAGSVLELTRRLVAIPSRGGLDPYGIIVSFLDEWLAGHGLPSSVLTDESGNAVALVCDVIGQHDGPHYVLDACLDTAPFGDESRWRHAPTSAIVENGWLHGRGSADSKSGVAIFCHLAVRLAAERESLHGTVTLLFDLDEHTGNFGGAKSYFENREKPDGVIIGYPGRDHLVIGGRGVHRTKIGAYGISSHSGARASTPNAVVKAAAIIQALAGAPTGGGKITVTAVDGGSGFSVTPDLCTLNVDVRTTAEFDAATAETLIREAVADVDRRWPGTAATTIEPVTTWPAYELAPDSPLRRAILDAAAGQGLAVTPKVAGPSNIGNYLAGRGIPATAGFGVVYEGLHATDERIRIDSIPSVQATYHAAIRALLSPGATPTPR
ncbi:M20 family metallopeptidase [Actinoplanes sp. HUAS TT8]|uniref:M20 family metallopeptidase n=1 Tax=Actinoplanes sp. HUAS TT8 TaxID=3447453 RepID=UPI003F52350D